MSKVAHTGDKRSEKRSQIGKSRKGGLWQQKKLYPLQKRKTHGGITGKVRCGWIMKTKQKSENQTNKFKKPSRQLVHLKNSLYLLEEHKQN